MDLIPTNIINLVTVLFKVFYIIIGLGIILVSLFHLREAEKMEKKLQVNLPIGVHIVMTSQLLLASLFVVVMLIILFAF